MSDSQRSGRHTPGYGMVVLVSAVTAAAVSVGSVWLAEQYGSPWLSQDASAQQSLTVQVPQLVSMSTQAADEVLRARGLRLVVSGRDASQDVEAGSIAQQSPLSGSRVREGDQVSVVVSTGPQRITVPEVVGRSVADARTALTQAGLTVGDVSETGTGAAAGTVTAIEPAGGTQVVAGATVAITATPVGTAVPNVVGKGSSKAKKLLEAAGFAVGHTTTRFDDMQGPYIVLAQDPAAGTVAPPQSTVDLVVNEGE